MTKPSLYEDIHIVLNVPFNRVVKSLFNTKIYDVKVFKEAGQAPFVVLREKVREVDRDLEEETILN